MVHYFATVLRVSNRGKTRAKKDPFFAPKMFDTTRTLVELYLNSSEGFLSVFNYETRWLDERSIICYIHMTGTKESEKSACDWFIQWYLFRLSVIELLRFFRMEVIKLVKSVKR